MTLPVAILAGGLATRLQPVTAAIPKSMVPINGQPFIAHQLRLLQSKGARRVVLCTGHLGEQIEAFVKDGAAFGLTVDYSRDGGRPLGTGGALRKAAHLLGEAFFVVYGDSYLDCDYAAVEQAFLDSRRDGLMTVFRNDGRWDKSNVLFEQGQILKYSKTVGVLATPQAQQGLSPANDAPPRAATSHNDHGLHAIRNEAQHTVPPNDGRVRPAATDHANHGLDASRTQAEQTLAPNNPPALAPRNDGQVSSAAMAHIDYGLGAIRTEALRSIPPHIPYDLAAFYQILLTQGQLAAYEVDRRFFEIGSFGGIRQLEEVLK